MPTPIGTLEASFNVDSFTTGGFTGGGGASFFEHERILTLIHIIKRVFLIFSDFKTGMKNHPCLSTNA